MGSWRGLGATLLRAMLAPPFFDGETFDCGVVARMSGAGEAVVLRMHRFEEVIRDHRADGMQRVMARQTFVHKACQSADNWLQPLGNLVLDDGMETGMNFDIGQLDAHGSMMGFNELYSFLLVERQPLRGGWGYFWIVVPHGASCGA